MAKTYTEEEIKEWFSIMKEKYHGSSRTYDILSRIDFMMFDRLWKGDNLDTIIEQKRKEKKKGHVHCPVNGWDCPYWDANGCCMMYPESNPLEECDDFAYFWDENDDFVCYDDHEKE